MTEYGWGYPPGCTQADHDAAFGDGDGDGDGDERGSREEWDEREADLAYDNREDDDGV